MRLELGLKRRIGLNNRAGAVRAEGSQKQMQRWSGESRASSFFRPHALCKEVTGNKAGKAAEGSECERS